MQTTFKPIYQNKPSDLRSRYQEMVSQLMESPKKIAKHASLFQEIFKPISKDKGEIFLSNNSFYFSLDGKALTDFVAIPLHIIFVHDVTEIHQKLELLILSQSAETTKIYVTSGELSRPLWIDNLGPLYIYDATKVHLIKVIIQQLVKYTPRKHIFNFSGWAVDEPFYIKSGRKLDRQTENTSNATQVCSHTFEMLDVAPHDITIPMISIAVLSLVQSKLVQLGTFFKGVCCLVAPTQSYKTSLASLFFDFEKGNEAHINFEATMSAITQTLGKTRDSVVIVDDYKPGSTKAERNNMLSKLNTIVRMCSDNSGGVKKALGPTSTISNVANCIVFLTAEQLNIDVQSTLARLLILDIDRKSVDVSKLSYFQKTHHSYREFIENFISYIASKDPNDYCAHLIGEFQNNRHFLRNKLQNQIVDNRTNDMCLWLYIAFSEFLNYARSLDVLSEDEYKKYHNRCISVFLSLLENQASLVNELDAISLFFNGLRVLLETNVAHIEHLQARTSSFSAPNAASAIGFSKKDYVYLKNGDAYQQVVSYYHRLGREFTITEAALRKSLALNGYIMLVGDKKSPIQRLSVNHASYQCIKFHKNTFEKLLKGGESNGESSCKLSSDRALLANANNLLGRSN